MARVTLEQIIVYEELVETKVKAEEFYYKDNRSILQESLKRGQVTEEREIVTRAAQNFQNDVFKSKDDLQAKDIRDAIDKLLESVYLMRLRYASAHTEYNEALLNSLEALDLHEKSLENVRKGLEKLQEEPSNVEQLQELFKFGKMTNEEFKKLNKPIVKQ